MKSFADIFQYDNGMAFPNTKAVTSSGPDSFDGTEYNKAFVDEIMGFFQAALFTAGVTPNGTTDTAQANQVLSSIMTISKTVRQGRFNVWPTPATKNGYVDCVITESICPSITPIPEVRKYTSISFMRGSTYNSCDVAVSEVVSNKKFVCYLEWDTNGGVNPIEGSSNGQPFAYIPCIAYCSSPVNYYSGFLSFDYGTVSLGGVPTRCITVSINLFADSITGMVPNRVSLKNCNFSFKNHD